MSSPAEQFTQLSQTSRKATEALSQAESACTHFASASRRSTTMLPHHPQQVGGGSGGSGSSSSSSAQDEKCEELLRNIDAAFERCAQSVDAAKRSPLFDSNALDMATLQALSSLQRQRLDAMRGDVADVERQMRMLQTRHNPAVVKYRSATATATYGGTSAPQQHQQASTNHVAHVLASSSSSSATPQHQQNLNTAGDYRQRERESITRVTTGVRQLVTESNAVLGALRTQRAKVADTDSRLAQVLSSAGVAQSIVKQVERMTAVDKLIVFGGIAALTCLMLYLWVMV